MQPYLEHIQVDSTSRVKSKEERNPLIPNTVETDVTAIANDSWSKGSSPCATGTCKSNTKRPQDDAYMKRLQQQRSDIKEKYAKSKTNLSRPDSKKDRSNFAISEKSNYQILTRQRSKSLTSIRDLLNSNDNLQNNFPEQTLDCGDTSNLNRKLSQSYTRPTSSEEDFGNVPLWKQLQEINMTMDVRPPLMN